MTMNNESATISIRPVAETDEASLWRLLCHAATMPGGDTPENIAEAQQSTILSHFVADWGRSGDVGVIAHTGSDLVSGDVVGAAWIRLGLDAVWEGHGFSLHLWSGISADEVDHAAPELAIAVFPKHRGFGVGERLLVALAREAAPLHTMIQLSVREDNPAVRLYERTGFRSVGEMTNRVGGRSLVMVKWLRDS